MRSSIVDAAAAPPASQRSWREMREAAIRRAPPPLPGKILYLEHLTVSFDGFKALNDLTLYVDPGELRCVIGPNGAGKTTMMDVITGKTRPDEGSAWFGQNVDLLSLSEPEIAAGRYRTQVSEADRLRVPDGVREPRAGAGGRQVVLEDAGRAADRRQPGAHRRSARRDRPQAERRVLAGTLVARAEAVARDRHAADAGSRSAAGRRAGGRHDAAGDRADRRTAAVARRQSTRSSSSSTTWSSCDRSPRWSRCFTRGSVFAEGDMDHVQNDPRVIEVYLGA